MTMFVLDARISKATEGGPSFTFGNRLFRAIWTLTWLLLASWTPPPFHPWRRLLLRVFGAKIAPSARVYGSAKIWYPPNLQMDAYSVLGWRALCYCMDRVCIGRYATVSQHSFLLTGSHDIDDPSFQLFTKPIVIEPFAWVCAGATIGPGVTVGEGAVLGASGAMFKDMQPWAVYVGNPAKKVRMRKKFS